MLVFTKSFIDKLGKWLSTPIEKFMIIILGISYFYVTNGLVNLILYEGLVLFAVKDIVLGSTTLVYGYLMYRCLKVVGRKE